MHIDYTLSIIIIDKVNTKSVLDDLTLKELVESFHSLQVTPQLLSNFNILNFFLIDAYSHILLNLFKNKKTMQHYKMIESTDKKLKAPLLEFCQNILSLNRY